MKTKNIISATSRNLQSAATSVVPANIPRDRLLNYFGRICLDKNEEIFAGIQRLMKTTPEERMYLAVSSAGGPSGAAMSFYDMVRHILRPNLITIGTGDVDSSGVIVFLSGGVRLIAKNTTLLLHPAGRYFDGETRYTARELGAVVREDRCKDLQYAAILSERSSALSPAQVLDMMHEHTVLTPPEIVAYGLADEVIG